MIANAVAHRTYERDESPVVVELRPNAVIPETVTVAALRQAQAARNHSIIDMLRRFGLAERPEPAPSGASSATGGLHLLDPWGDPFRCACIAAVILVSSSVRLAASLWAIPVLGGATTAGGRGVELVLDRVDLGLGGRIGTAGWSVPTATVSAVVAS